jgi:hypothetical protein
MNEERAPAPALDAHEHACEEVHPSEPTVLLANGVWLGHCEGVCRGDEVEVVVTPPSGVGRTTSFDTHRKVLAGGSDYFACLLTGTWAFNSLEASRFELRVAPESFAAVLAFLTHGRVLLPESQLLPVLEVAHYLQVQPLVAAVDSALRQRLCATNCVAAWQLADFVGLPEVRAVARSVAMRECSAVLLHLHLEDQPTAGADGALLVEAVCRMLASACGADDDAEEAGQHGGAPHASDRAHAFGGAVERAGNRAGGAVAAMRERAAAAGAIEAIVSWLNHFSSDKAKAGGMGGRPLAAALRALAAVCAGGGAVAAARRRRAAAARALEALVPCLCCGQAHLRAAAAEAAAVLCVASGVGAGASGLLWGQPSSCWQHRPSRPSRQRSGLSACGASRRGSMPLAARSPSAAAATPPRSPRASPTPRRVARPRRSRTSRSGCAPSRQMAPTATAPPYHTPGPRYLLQRCPCRSAGSPLRARRLAHASNNNQHK